jgi:hypothetical protein
MAAGLAILNYKPYTLCMRLLLCSFNYRVTVFGSRQTGWQAVGLEGCDGIHFSFRYEYDARTPTEAWLLKQVLPTQS